MTWPPAPSHRGHDEVRPAATPSAPPVRGDHRRLARLRAGHAGRGAGRGCRRLRGGDLERADLRLGLPGHRELHRRQRRPPGPPSRRPGLGAGPADHRSGEGRPPRGQRHLGVSNTTFYEVPIAELPPAPTGRATTRTRRGVPASPTTSGPTSGTIRLHPRSRSTSYPRGRVQLARTRESLLRRVLDPAEAVAVAAAGTSVLRPLLQRTRRGPEEVGITDPDAAMAYKAKALLRCSRSG